MAHLFSLLVLDGGGHVAMVRGSSAGGTVDCRRLTGGTPPWHLSAALVCVVYVGKYTSENAYLCLLFF